MIEYENLRRLNEPFFAEYLEQTKKVLESGWFVLGEEVKSFEAEFAKYCNTPHCVGVASGLDALVLSLRALDLPAGSEVIVPSNTYIATILSIMQLGHKPVLVEPKLDTYNIDPQEIEKHITAKTRAVMVVHLYGKLCEMTAIQSLCQKHKLTLIEDCAQSHGANYQGKMAGAFGIGCFSFYPTKNLGALGDAGALTCNDADLAEKFRILRNYGSKVKYHNEVVGYNSRLDEIQAAFLRVKLKHLGEITTHKQKLAKIYHENIPANFIKPIYQAGYEDVFHIYNIRHPQRDKLRAYLLENNIKTEVHYPIPPHQQKALENIFRGQSFPISEEIHKTTLSLPISFFHTEDDIMKVCARLKAFKEHS